MNPEPLLLAFHVTLALGLTILLGSQIVALGRIRTAVTPEQRRPLSSPIMAAITAVPIVTLVVAVTGGMLLGQGARGGPWIGAGVFSALVIATTALWTLRQARRGHDRRGRRLGSAITAAQWGAPAFTLAAAFLMAYRPDTVGGALSPVLVAIAVTAAGFRTTQRTPATT